MTPPASQAIESGMTLRHAFSQLLHSDVFSKFPSSSAVSSAITDVTCMWGPCMVPLRQCRLHGDCNGRTGRAPYCSGNPHVYSTLYVSFEDQPFVVQLRRL